MIVYTLVLPQLHHFLYIKHHYALRPTGVLPRPARAPSGTTTPNRGAPPWNPTGRRSRPVQRSGSCQQAEKNEQMKFSSCQKFRKTTHDTRTPHQLDTQTSVPRVRKSNRSQIFWEQMIFQSSFNATTRDAGHFCTRQAGLSLPLLASHRRPLTGNLQLVSLLP